MTELIYAIPSHTLLDIVVHKGEYPLEVLFYNFCNTEAHFILLHGFMELYLVIYVIYTYVSVYFKLYIFTQINVSRLGTGFPIKRWV